MQISFLGTGAPLSPNRATLGLLIKDEGAEALLIDSSGGFEIYRSLANIGQKLDEIKHFVISHRHGDHMAGIMAISLASRTAVFYGLADTMKATEQLFELSYPSVSPVLDIKPKYVNIDYGESRNIAGYNFSFYKANHRVPTVAIRVERNAKVLAYSADSLPSSEIIESARDADIFICDALCASSDISAERLRGLMHPSAKEAAQMAQKAKVKSLAMVHIARFANTEKMLTEARENYSGPISIPFDGSQLII